MSLIAFQLALAELGTSPGFCERVAADPGAALAGRDLTERERRRIVSAAGQEGVRVNWALYRYNRMIPLTEVLRGTCHLLGAAFDELAAEFWAEEGLNRNMRNEAERFAGFLRRALAAGRLSSPYLAQVLAFEMMRYQVATRPRPPLLAAVAEAAERWPDGPLALHPLMRVASFTYEPNALLGLVGARRPPPYPGLPEGEFHLLLDFHSGTYQQDMLDPAWANVILDVAARRGTPDPEAVRKLVDAGILVRTAPSGVAEASSPLEAMAGAAG